MSSEYDRLIEQYHILTPGEKYAKLLGFIALVPPVESEGKIPERDESISRIISLASSADTNPADLRREICNFADTYPPQEIRRIQSTKYKELLENYRALNETVHMTGSCRVFLVNSFESFYQAGNRLHPQSIPYLTEIITRDDRDTDLRRKLASGVSLQFLLGVDNPNEQEGYFNPDNLKDFERVRYYYLVRDTRQTEQLVEKLFYKNTGNEKPDPSRSPSFKKQQLIHRWRGEYIRQYRDEP